jgi:hypothetical protein
VTEHLIDQRLEETPTGPAAEAARARAHRLHRLLAHDGDECRCELLDCEPGEIVTVSAVTDVDGTPASVAEQRRSTVGASFRAPRAENGTRGA